MTFSKQPDAKPPRWASFYVLNIEMSKYFSIIFLLVLLTTKSKGQIVTKIDTFKLKGNWTVCTSLSFSKTYNCEKGYVTYEFFENGTFKDPRPSLDGGGQHLYSMGKWNLINNILTIDYDDTEYSQSPSISYEIIMLTNTKFYTVGQEGENGPTVYTYFQKIE